MSRYIFEFPEDIFFLSLWFNFFEESFLIYHPVLERISLSRSIIQFLEAISISFYHPIAEKFICFALSSNMWNESLSRSILFYLAPSRSTIQFLKEFLFLTLSSSLWNEYLSLFMIQFWESISVLLRHSIYKMKFYLALSSSLWIESLSRSII
jgi:hypothetical protein